MLQIKNLFVEYKDAKHPAIQDVSFEIKKGDHLAILGPSGCGKSTTLGVIAGTITSQEAVIKGQIRWEHVTKNPIIRVVFQKATLLPWRTVAKNIAIGLETKKLNREEIIRKVQEILGVVGLREFANSYPWQLSVGMAQRVNFARALVCEPDLLLLDEPFSALDIETKKTIQAEFLNILKEKEITSILVTHNIAEAVSMANRVIVLSKGPSEKLHEIKGDISQQILMTNAGSILDNLEIYE